MRIADILRHKAAGAEVVTISPDGTVPELLARLAEHNIGAVLVTEADGSVVGVVSERDLARQLHRHGPAALDRAVRDLMTTSVVDCGPQDSVDSVAATMTERRIRHMPVLDGGRLIGIVSIGDVVLSRIRQLEQDSRQLEQYIRG
jgi:CBS domain-containing protein